MPTPKFDMIATDFVARIPDSFQTPFTIGGEMPDSFILKKETISNYVNRALNKVFSDLWLGAGADKNRLINVVPELTKVSNNINFINGRYTIGQGYLDLFKIIGATVNNKFAKVKEADKLTLYLTGEYPEYMTTDNDPVIILSGGLIYLFPQLTRTVILHYIVKPVNPITGGYLEQNGSYDSPFDYHWHDTIAEAAYQLYLRETLQTT